MVAIVLAVNANGEGAYSEPNSVGAVIEVEPGKMKAPVRGSGTTETQIELTWTIIEGTDTGGAAIDSYNLKWDQGTGTWAELIDGDGDFQLGTDNTQTVDVLAGYSYNFTVRAHNAHGWGEESDITVIVAAQSPETPDSPSSTVHNHFVKISWIAPYENSAPIIGYRIYISDADGQFL